MTDYRKYTDYIIEQAFEKGMKIVFKIPAPYKKR